MKTRKTILTIALLLLAAFATFAQQEIPMFFDRELGLVVEGRFGFTHRVAYSPDGNRIAMSNNNNNIVIWDTATGREISRLTGHRDSINGILFSPTGRQLASRSRDSTIRIWNPLTGELLHNIPQAVGDFAFSPDGNRLVGSYYISESDRGIKIWNTANGSEIRTIALTTSINSVSYSPDGRQILAATGDGIRIFDAGNGQPIRSINSGAASLNAVYSPNGQHITAYFRIRGANGEIKTFNPLNGQELWVIPVSLVPYDIIYSPDGRQLLVNGWADDGNTRIMQIFDPDTGRELRRFADVDVAIAFSPDGRRILTDSDSFEFRIEGTTYGATYANILDAATGRTIGTIGYGPLNIGAKAFADLQIARFLGDTAAVNRHEEVLRFITGRGNATRAEVEAFYRNGIRGLVSDMVDEQYAGLRTGWQNFNVPAARLVEVKQAITNFMLNPSTASYAELLATYRRRDGGEVTLLLGQTMGQINREINRALLDNRVLVSP